MNRILAILLLLSSNSFAQDTVSIKKWKSVPLPTNRDTLILYNWSKTWWKVNLKNDEIFAVISRRNLEELPFKPNITQTEKFFNIVLLNYILPDATWQDNQGKRLYKLSSFTLHQDLLKSDITTWLYINLSSE